MLPIVSLISYLWPSTKRNRGYGMWSTDIGAGGTPCFSTLPGLTTAPPLLVTAMGQPESTPTSAVLNLVYAVRYPVKSSHLPQSTAIAIGVGSGIAGLLLFSLAFLVGCLICKRRPNYATQQQSGAFEGPGKSGMSAKTVSVPGYSHTPSSSVSALEFTHTGQNTQFPSYAPGSHVLPRGASSVAAYSSAPRVGPSVQQTTVPVSVTHSPPPNSNFSRQRVSPIQTPQELHDPNWAGRQELEGPS